MIKFQASRLFRSPMLAASVLGLSLLGAAALRASPAPTPPPPQPVTVALVDLAKLMNGLDETKAKNEANKAEGQKMQDELDKLSEQIDKLTKDLQPGGAIPDGNSDRRNQAMAELYQDKAMLKAKKETYQTLFDVKRGNIINELYGKITVAIGEFAKREGYDLVLLDDRAIELPPMNTATVNELNPVIEKKRILFARDGLDVTDRLITIMNNQYNSAAPAPGATPPAPPPSTGTKGGSH